MLEDCMTDIKLLELLLEYYAAQRNVTTYMLWAMEDLERGCEQYSWNWLFLWCEVKDDREELWSELKLYYTKAMMLKEGYYP